MAWGNSRYRERLSWEQGPGSLDEEMLGDSSSENRGQTLPSQEQWLLEWTQLGRGECRLRAEASLQETFPPWSTRTCHRGALSVQPGSSRGILHFHVEQA